MVYGGAYRDPEASVRCRTSDATSHATTSRATTTSAHSSSVIAESNDATEKSVMLLVPSGPTTGMRVSVIGGGRVDAETYERARRLGERLAERGHSVVCGGYSGVMEAVCRGAKAEGGHTIGILKGTDPTAGNDYLDTPIATGIGNARNVLVVVNGDAVVAVNGGTGTLSELGHALDAGKPVAGLDTHDLAEFVGFEACETVAEAIESVERRVEG